jgi:hypothetical protein
MDSDDNNDDNGSVKESNNLNKSKLPESEQKKILKKFAGMHGFSKAPGADNGQIEMDGDSLHGYNRTMNEAKADLKNRTSKTKDPVNDKKAQMSDIKNKSLSVASDKKENSKLTKGTSNTNFAEAPGDDNINKGKNVNPKNNLGAAPGNHNKVNGKELGKDLVRKAPEGKNKSSEFNANDVKDEEVYNAGYNLKESEEVKKN